MIKVLIVEDEGLFRDMLKISLSSFENLQVVDAVASGAEALKATKESRPNVVLMDIELGSEPNGFETGRMISPNPPKDTDGRREESGRGGVRELQGK